jgi:hypothetical protein
MHLFPLRATYPTHPTYLEFINLITFCEDCQSKSSYYTVLFIVPLLPPPWSQINFSASCSRMPLSYVIRLILYAEFRTYIKQAIPSSPSKSKGH